jgi:hypothetical protein
MASLVEIIARFDALDAGDVGLFLCTDGQIGAHIPTVDIRAEYTLKSLTGYAETVEEAITALWDQALGIERDECLLIRHQGERRAVRWNGAAWKPVTLPPAPEVGV